MIRIKRIGSSIPCVSLVCLLLLILVANPTVAEESKKTSSTLISQEISDMEAAMGQLLSELGVPHTSQDLPEDFIHPVMVIAGFRGYNIVKYKGIFYGVDTEEGPIDVPKIKSKAKYPWFSSDSVEDLKATIEKEGRPPKSIFERIVGRIKRLTGSH